MKKTGLDAIDLRILGAVQQHGQLSKTRLAEIVNLSPSPCLARLDRLRAAGFIRGYHADIALERIGPVTRVTVMVALTSHRKTVFERFEAYIRDIDEIVDCVATGGGVDYIMTVLVPSLEAFQTLMDDLLAADLEIDNYRVYFATRRVKSDRPNLVKLARGVGL
jgi:Lrp/AsnC family transcriptional regulator of ectoine degradation